MKNAMQLKAILKNMAKQKNISAQLVLQNYMLERLLERVSVSQYRNNFILKGGFLIAAMVGLDTRATMDMDATLKGYPVNEETVRKMFEEICAIELNDDVTIAIRFSKENEDCGELADITKLFVRIRIPADGIYPDAMPEFHRSGAQSDRKRIGGLPSVYNLYTDRKLTAI